MTPLAQRIAISEACGNFIPRYIVSEEYVDDPHWNSGFWQTTASFEDGEKVRLSGRLSDLGGASWGGYYAQNKFPDYLNDLNAMFAAEETLTDEQRRDYAHRLGLMVGPRGYDEWSGLYDFYLTHLTAAQRAEAFLKTIGKWEDDR